MSQGDHGVRPAAAAISRSSSIPTSYPSSPSLIRSASHRTNESSSTAGTQSRPVGHRITSTLRRMSRPDNNREWSLFGQMMENEGQLRHSAPSASLSSSGNFDSRYSGASAVIPLIEENSRPATPLSFGSDVPNVRTPPNERAPPAMMGYFVELPPPPLPQEREYDSDENSDEEANAPNLVKAQPPPGWYHPSSWPALPVVYRNVLKCALAYWLASLFTFNPYLSSFIADITSNGPGEKAPSPSAHMVATVAVYFNPAKTAGGMLEADTYCIFGVLYATFICLGSMSMFWPLELSPGWEWLGDVLVILWIGIGCSVMTWMKVWMSKPAFNTACSNTAIILFVVIVKEGGLETLGQVSFISLVGALISNLVCYLIWPQSATRQLRDNMTKTLDSFQTLLKLLVGTFLLEDNTSYLSPEKLQKAIDNHQNSFLTLKKNLSDAHSEWLCDGPAKPSEANSGRSSAGKAYEDAIASLNRLGQHLNGLRSGTNLQYDLAKAQEEGRINLRRNAEFPPPVTEDDTPRSSDATEEEVMLQVAAMMFGDLVDDLGPPLRALSTNCGLTLHRLREVFSRRRKAGTVIPSSEFAQLTALIEQSLFTFESTSNHALVRLYRRRENLSEVDENTNKRAVPLRDNEGVFLVYFFIFTLQEFALELISLVDAFSRICAADTAVSDRWWKQAWSTVTTCFGDRLTRRQSSGLEHRGLNRISSMIIPQRIRQTPVFPRVRPHAPNTIQTPARVNLSFKGRLAQRTWALGKKLKEPDIKYAVKTGMAMSILAAPAFFDSTRPWFTKYRGEWALISFFVVMSRTIGQTNALGLHRVLGTIFGSATAYVVYSTFSQDPYILCAFGFFFSIPCFYYIVAQPKYASSGRFVLLTYNLTCLYCYNIRQREVDVKDIAIDRFLSVAIGVVWAWLVSRYWWPMEARRELGKALSEFCNNLGWLYTRLISTYSAPETFTSSESNRHSTGRASSSSFGPGGGSHHNGNSLFQHHSDNVIGEFMAMELHLQIRLIEMQDLLAQTQHEPRLKGPFPIALYRSILASLQAILDRLHSIRCVTTREEWFTEVRRDFIIPVNKERREMVGNVLLYLSTLSAAFQLKAPLPPYLPPAETSRQRLVDAIRNLEVVKNRDAKGSRHLLFFAYTLTMKGIIQELEFLGKTLQDAFGVIGQTSEEFEALFRMPAHVV